MPSDEREADIRLLGNRGAANTVSAAYEAAALDDKSAFLRLAGSATYELVGAPSNQSVRELQISDLKLQAGCLLRTIEAASANEVVVTGHCMMEGREDFSWPYEARLALRGGRITTFGLVPFEL